METNIKSEIKIILGSKLFKRIIIIFGAIILALLIFRVGVSVGYRKASFGNDWNNNYPSNFEGKHPDFRMMQGGLGDWKDSPNSHGAIGRIIKIEIPSVVVIDDHDQIEKVIIIDNNTKIMRGRNQIKQEDLGIDNSVIVIGIPNSQGQIEAKLIRVMPTNITNNPLQLTPGATI